MLPIFFMDGWKNIATLTHFKLLFILYGFCLVGKNVIRLTQMGSIKTRAFGFPLLHALLEAP